jgi:hypothetical protein
MQAFHFSWGIWTIVGYLVLLLFIIEERNIERHQISRSSFWNGFFSDADMIYCDVVADGSSMELFECIMTNHERNDAIRKAHTE